jgi:hypothetical protein
LGNLDRDVVVDFQQDLIAAGVDTARLAARAKECKASQNGICGFKCNVDKDLSATKCVGELGGAKLFGRLADKIGLVGFGGIDSDVPGEEGYHSANMVAAVAGVLEYEWSDAAGTTHTRSSPFREILSLGMVNGALECGDGASVKRVASHPLALKVDQAGYRIAVPFKDSVAAGRVARYALSLIATRASEHDFTFVLQLSDGRIIRSRPVNLLYFLPSRYLRSDR